MLLKYLTFSILVRDSKILQLSGEKTSDAFESNCKINN